MRMKNNRLLIRIIGFLVSALLVATGILLFPELTGKPYVRVAESLYRNYDNIGAYRYLVHAIDSYPADEDLAYLLVKVINEAFLLKSSDSEYSTSSRHVTRIADAFKDTRNSRLLTEIGYAYLLANDRRAAIAFLEKSLQADPGYFYTYNCLGNCYYNITRNSSPCGRNPSISWVCTYRTTISIK
jgi:tetratricopeptide (TPR) repeat protein